MLNKNNPGAAASAPENAGRFVFCSSNQAHARWLSEALKEWDVSQQELKPPDQLIADILASAPRLILLDFSGSCADKVIECGMNMIALAQALRIKAPHRTLVAVGTIAYPEGAVAALRAGISHFIDMSASAGEAREIILKLIAAAPDDEVPVPVPGAVIALLGVRAGVGTTTLAVHLADLLRKYKTAEQRDCRVCLLDLGWPAGDGQLYLNASGNFHFVDIMNSRHRLDRTLIQTAMTHSDNGVTIIPLPPDMPATPGFASTDAIALLTQLKPYFDVLIIDLGGHGDPAFAIQIANAADQLWLVTDQSAGALVSLAALLKKLGKREGDIRNRHLIVNRHDKQYGMIAPQIAERFGLPLAALIPDCTLSLMHSANRGKLLHDVVRSDPYLRAVEALAAQIIKRRPSAWRHATWHHAIWPRWTLGFFLKRQQRRKTDKDGDGEK